MNIANLYVDSIVQLNDLVRIDVSRSIIDELSTVEVKADTNDDFIVLSENLYLDHAYNTTGTKEVTLRITDKDSNEFVLSKNVLVKSPLEEKLFSNDQMLLNLEQSIFGLLPDGKSSFVYAHRVAQDEILRTLSDSGIKVVAENIYDIDEVKRWSSYLTLSFIFESNIVSNDDIHLRKKDLYESKASYESNRAMVRIDKDNDGQVDFYKKRIPSRLRLV